MNENLHESLGEIEKRLLGAEARVIRAAKALAKSKLADQKTALEYLEHQVELLETVEREYVRRK